MACKEGIDPADFESGVGDPGDDTPPDSELVIHNTDAVVDPDQTVWARLRVSVSNINYNDDITVSWTTVQGTAVSSGGNAHFVADSDTLTIPAGNGDGEIEVQIRKGSPLHSGTKTFTVVLSGPSNAVLDDATASVTIDYNTINGNAPPPPDPATLSEYTGWPKPGVVYDQFSQCGYKSACTGFAGAAALSALRHKRGLGNARFNAKKLFEDSGGKICGGPDCNHTSCNCSDCPPFSMTAVLSEMRAAAVGKVGVQLLDNNPTVVGGTNYGCTSRSPDSGMYKIARFTELGGGGQTVAQIINKIKRAIHEHGAVYMASIFYSNWNQCRSADNFILRPHGSETSAMAHAWVLTGWNNAKGDGGCFEIQSSHGCDWGAGGRGWIPYSYLRATWPSGSNAPRYRYWEVEWGGSV